MGHRVLGQREGANCSDVDAIAGFSTLEIAAYCKSSLQTGGNSQRGRTPQELKQMLRSQKCVSPCMCSHLSDLFHQPTTCLTPKTPIVSSPSAQSHVLRRSRPFAHSETIICQVLPLSRGWYSAPRKLRLPHALQFGKCCLGQQRLWLLLKRAKIPPLDRRSSPLLSRSRDDRHGGP